MVITYCISASRSQAFIIALLMILLYYTADIIVKCKIYNTFNRGSLWINTPMVSGFECCNIYILLLCFLQYCIFYNGWGGGCDAKRVVGFTTVPYVLGPKTYYPFFYKVWILYRGGVNNLL